jgi:predicted anti-sigma-YlaC factor YlaD
MTVERHTLDLMRYIDREMTAEERLEFEKHLAVCDQCRNMLNEMNQMKEATDTVKIADLPEAVWERYWTGIYNRIERSVAWFLFIAGALILTLYGLFKVVTDPGVTTIVGLGVIFLVVGFAVLMLSVLREKLAVNKVDKYISEVKR